MKKLAILFNGILRENPVLVLVLGTCPTLAVTDNVSRALGMGLSTAAVLICSNFVISLLKKMIPNTVRIPAYIVIIAGFVTAVQMLLEAYLPTLHAALGIYLALIVVNCIILGRAEMFAREHSALDSVLDGIGMGVGFTLTLVAMATIREILGNGSWFSISLPIIKDHTVPFFISAPGGFFAFAVLIALCNLITKKKTPVRSCGNCKACMKETENCNA